jgi:hypothetical protein
VPIQSKSEFTDGDWITAALVGPEHAERKLKELAGQFSRLRQIEDRDEKIDHMVERVQSVISELLKRYENGGATDEARLDACVAKIVADVLQRELANFQWSAEEKSNVDPVVVFRDAIKAFSKREKNKWK